MRVLVATLLLATSAAAQTNPIAGARKAFDECVYNSVAAQILQLPPEQRPKPDMSALTEIAFQACATEERAMVAFLANQVSDPQVLQTAILGVRVQLKRALQDIAANPAAYRK